MSHKTKNIIIVFLCSVIVFLIILLFIQSSGKYCRTLVPSMHEGVPGF